MSAEPWFVSHPERLSHELQALTDANASVEIDEAFKEAGRIRLIIDWPVPSGFFDGIVDSDTIRLIATFPDTYPYFRPHVQAPELSHLPRHVHPSSGGLCLLARPTQFWDVDRTLANLLEQQLPVMLAAGSVTDPDALAADPEEQAEPISGYYLYQETSPVLLDDRFLDGLGGAQRGRLRLGLTPGSGVGARIAALEVLSGDGVLSSLPEPLVRQFSTVFRGIWYRLSKAPAVMDAESTYQWLIKTLKDEGQTLLDSDPVKVIGGKIINVIGLIFPEERAPGQSGLGLAFLVRYQKQAPSSGATQRIQTPTQTYIAPAARVSRRAYADRIPRLAPISDKTALVVGLGTLGAPLAIELARSGIGRLRLADCDVVEAPTTVRWPIGIWAVGAYKVDALRGFITQNYPFTKIGAEDVYREQIGAPRLTAGLAANPLEPERLGHLLEGVNLIVDATAEPGISHLLSSMARERRVPFVSLYATRGGWGGLVMREIPDATEGCWLCLQHRLYDGTISPPPEDQAGGVQPLGCMDPTFTGVGFDLAPVTSAGVRMAVSTLCGGHENAYPDLSWDVAVLRLVGDDHAPCPPTWNVYKLDRHPDCAYCKFLAEAA